MSALRRSIVKKVRMPLNAVSKKRTHQVLLEDLRAKILDLEILPGSKVNEAELSAELGVSRTPLREALRTLESEGLVWAEHNRGFWIAPLRAEEVSEIYPIICVLEGLALREGAIVLRSRVSQLQEINRRLRGSSTRPLSARRLDSEFHDVLVSSCHNRQLLSLIAGLKRRTRRYEATYMRESALVVESCKQHAEIVEALEAGDIGRAAAALEANWKFGMTALLSRIPYT